MSSDAYIYAALNKGCTLLLDEVDTYMGGAKDAVTGILNSGHARDMAFVGRMQKHEVTGKFEPIKYSTFNPIAFGSKEKTLPDTLASRSIMLTLTKLTPKQAKEKAKFRTLLGRKELEELGRRVSRWAQATGNTPLWFDMEEMDPRRADTWRPLFAIAALAGPEWVNRAQAALDAEPAQKKAPKVRLLLDIKAIFDERKTDFIASEELVSRLCEGEWDEMWNGKPLTKTGLAKMLDPFKIKPDRGYAHQNKKGKLMGPQVRGYRRELFEPTWETL